MVPLRVDQSDHDLGSTSSHEISLLIPAGVEFDQLPPEEKLGALQSMAVFCRVEPSHKQRLVEMLKAQVPHPFHIPLAASVYWSRFSAETEILLRSSCSCVNKHSSVRTSPATI